MTKDRNIKIGIFGGSFNPPHNIHRKIALELIKDKQLDKVIFVPTGDKYNKKDLISVKHRLNMLDLMIKNYKNLEVSDYEVKNDLVYTYQTLDYFKDNNQNCEIYFICGSDNLKAFKTWKNYDYILNTFKIIVIRRDEDNIKDLLKSINNRNIKVMDKEVFDLSSTYIRDNIMNKKILNPLVDKDVLAYIYKNSLYI